jgi:hypothetical protein
MKLVNVLGVSILSMLTASYTLEAMENESKQEEDYVPMSVKQIQDKFGHKIIAASQGALQQKQERENPKLRTAVPVAPPAPGMEDESFAINSQVNFVVQPRVPSEIKVKVDVEDLKALLREQVAQTNGEQKRFEAFLLEQANREQKIKHEVEIKTDHLERMIKEQVAPAKPSHEHKEHISGAYADKLLFWGALAAQAVAVGAGLYTWSPAFKNATDKVVARVKEGYKKSVDYCKKHPLGAFAFGSALTGLALSGWWSYTQSANTSK